MAWTYAGDPSASDVAAVRFEISDTDVNAQLFQDAEVAWAILEETGVAAGTPATIVPPGTYSAGARLLETLARKIAMQADTEIGSLKASYKDAAKNLAARAAELRARAIGMRSPWAGGQSIAAKEAYAEDPDQVQPEFRRGEFNNPYVGRRNPADLGPPFS